MSQNPPLFEDVLSAKEHVLGFMCDSFRSLAGTNEMIFPEAMTGSYEYDGEYRAITAYIIWNGNKIIKLTEAFKPYNLSNFSLFEIKISSWGSETENHFFHQLEVQSKYVLLPSGISLSLPVF